MKNNIKSFLESLADLMEKHNVRAQSEMDSHIIFEFIDQDSSVFMGDSFNEMDIRQRLDQDDFTFLN